MSTLSELLRDAAALVLPPVCPVCGTRLMPGERGLCTLCRLTAPLTGYCGEADNPVLRKFWGLVPVVRASAFLYYVRDSGWRRMIHVPLPLHPVKRIWRGYNQSEYLAEGIAAALGVAVDRRSVRRSRYTSSQALKPHRERAGNVEGAFAVRHPERLAGRHILLVDDVMTTGSTLASCAQAIVQAVPDCRISIAVLAVSRRELGLKE